MTIRPVDPITELTTAARSPFSFLVGALVGGAAPALNWYTVHMCGLIVDGRVEWRSPLWVLVAGAFGLSAKSVYRWGRRTFGDPWSAASLVALLEGALLLLPDPICLVALGYLVWINATVYGCALALQYQANRAAAKAAAAAVAAVVEAAPEAVQPPSRALPAPKPVSSSGSSSTLKTPMAPRGDLYERAVDAIKAQRAVSTEWLRTGLKIRQPAAAALIANLEREGLIGRPDPADHGRRPVLTRAESA